MAEDTGNEDDGSVSNIDDLEEEAETIVDRTISTFVIAPTAPISKQADFDAWSHHSEVVEGPDATHELLGKATHQLDPSMLKLLEQPAKVDGLITQRHILGEGGMAVVYLADQVIPPRQVAIKRLRTNTPEGAERLFAEALLTGSLEHPNIIPVHSINPATEHGPEVVLKRVEGTSLQDAYTQEGGDASALRQLLPKLIQVCHALEYAHSREVYHRDVKPDNIMLGQFGAVYLLDWGIAIDKRRTEAVHRGTVGTPHYIAPEMLSGEPEDIDARTDVYLLGGTLHYLLVGEPRHEAATTISALIKASKSEPYEYPASVYPELGDLANRACAANPDDRPQTVAEFRRAIEDCLIHWDAMRTVQRAQPEIETFLLTARADLALPERVRLYDRVTSRLKSALSSWPQCPAARERMWQVQSYMVSLYAQAQQASAAEPIMEQLERHYPRRQDELVALRERLSTALERETRVHAHVAETDMSPSRGGRRRAAIGLLVVVSIISAVMAYFEYHRPAPRTALEGLVVWSIGTALYGIMVAINLRKISSNAAGRRALFALILSPLMILLIRVVVYARDQDPIAMHAVECFVLAFGCTAAAESFPRGPAFGLLALVLGAIALMLPTFAYAALIAALLSSSAGLVSHLIDRQTAEG